MKKTNWPQEFSAAIIVCDPDGIVLEMNDKACQVYEKFGGAKLIGQNMMDCHPEPAKSKLIEIMKQRVVNSYTIEKNGVHKLIYQAPWFTKGQYQGYVEISMEIPQPMPHFIRS